MPSDLTGLSSVDRVPLPPASSAAGTGATSSSRALTRIAPVDPRLPTANPAANPPHPLLGRSGLDLLDLLSTTDLVSHREPAGSVAVEVGLEQARGALLRNRPADALASLDAVWEGARHTEEGWYLRSASLTVLGLPNESAQVAAEGLSLRPASMALRFIESFSRMLLGDLTGARAALQPALLRAPTEPLLVVQHALIQARQGDTRAAEAQLSQLATSPEHPAMAWGRAALRAIVADATRLRSRPTPTDWPTAIPTTAFDSARTTPLGHDAIFPDITSGMDRHGNSSRAKGAGAVDLDPQFGEGTKPDVAMAALERFGARVAMRPLDEVAREARMLMRAFSAGGTLVSASTAEQTHAVRTILTTFLGVATGEGAEAPGPLRTMVEQLLPLLRQGRFEDAERVVRRQSMLTREPIGRLLLAMVRGAILAGPERVDAPIDGMSDGRVLRDTRATPVYTEWALRASGTPSGGQQIVRGDSDRAPLIPARLGLGLLEETAGSRVIPGAPATVRDDYGLVTFSASGSVPVVSDAESAGTGWGAASAHLPPPRHADWADGAGVRAAALVCVGLAAAALVTSHGAMAIGLAAGAVWLGLRRSGREGDGSRPHDRTTRL